MKRRLLDAASGLKRIPIMLALALLCAAGGFHRYGLEPAEARLETLESTLSQRKAGAVVRPARAQPNGEVAGQLGQFYGFFDGELTYVDWLARFYAAAAASGISAQRAEYRTVEPAGIPLVVYEISMPVTADYARIRHFVENVLNNVPVASLDQITFKRANPNQAEVEADLRFTFYLAKP